MTHSTYRYETSRETQRATILCGARRGYTSDNSITLDDVCDAFDSINKSLQQEKKQTLGCIVTESVLVGRTGEVGYRERIYRCELSTSPRAEPIEQHIFLGALMTYLNELGKTFEQERRYTEWDGITYVYRKSGEKQV